MEKVKHFAELVWQRVQDLVPRWPDMTPSNPNQQSTNNSNSNNNSTSPNSSSNDKTIRLQKILGGLAIGVVVQLVCAYVLRNPTCIQWTGQDAALFTSIMMGYVYSLLNERIRVSKGMRC